jgi:hypothetical protein
MTGYADPELLVSAWLGERLDAKVWADPRLPDNWSFNAPIGHVQRGAGEGDTVLTLDAAIIDVDWYAKNADHARELAERSRFELRTNLPLHTFPGGFFCMAVQTVTAPFWAPDPTVFRRSATYRVVLHGLTTS